MIMRIKELRVAAGMTQGELAAGMGVNQNTISQWEHEVVLPRTRQLPELARLLGVNFNELFANADTEAGYGEETYAKRVLDGEVADETYFVMIRELPAGANPHDKALWLMANPCLRYPNEYSAYLLEQIEAEYTAAYGSNDPHKIRQFLTRRMCQWQTGSVNRYLDEKCMELARMAQIPREAFAALTDGRECWCGFDLGNGERPPGVSGRSERRREPFDQCLGGISADGKLAVGAFPAAAGVLDGRFGRFGITGDLRSAV